MTKLTDRVQNCGLCSNCNGITTKTISYKDAQKAIEVVKNACKDAVMEIPVDSNVQRRLKLAIDDVE
jgi:hypothetical protein